MAVVGFAVNGQWPDAEMACGHAAKKADPDWQICHRRSILVNCWAGGTFYLSVVRIAGGPLGVAAGCQRTRLGQGIPASHGAKRAISAVCAFIQVL